MLPVRRRCLKPMLAAAQTLMVGFCQGGFSFDWMTAAKSVGVSYSCNRFGFGGWLCAYYKCMKLWCDLDNVGLD